ncbi:MAG: trimethylamine methyltransferase family protein, partial [Actinobacteria bacterium]|nr:trimethylamine methyltransferase family protein [Actinomycetota bacterium]
HFLGEEHTRDHMRDFWVSPVFNRDSWENWEEAGKPDPSEHAHERVKEILETHEPLPLAEDQTAELRKIVDTYQQERAEED